MTGPTTMVTLDYPLFANTSIFSEVADITRLKFYQVTGPKMVLRSPSVGETGPFSEKLWYFGLHKDAAALAGRELFSRPTMEPSFQPTLPTRLPISQPSARTLPISGCGSSTSTKSPLFSSSTTSTRKKTSLPFTATSFPPTREKRKRKRYWGTAITRSSSRLSSCPKSR